MLSGVLFSLLTVLFQIQISLQKDSEPLRVGPVFQEGEPFCQSQGPLSFPLGSTVVPKPASLLFCKQHSACTCCNASSSLALQKSAQSWLSDQQLSASCKASMVTLTCRYCDSKIGVGIEAGLCPAFCTSLHRACREDFFHYPLHGDFGPCAVDRQSSVVCAKMVEFAASGSQLCSMLGLLAHDAATCFDGTPSTLPSCAQTPLPRRGKRSPAATGVSGIYLLLKVVGGVCLLAIFVWSRIGRRGAPQPLVRGLPYGQRLNASQARPRQPYRTLRDS